MNTKNGDSLASRAKELLIGEAKNPHDRMIFHHMSLIAFFAWVGLGTDGLSSSCYGPEEAFLALGGHTHLILFVALATIITVFLVSSSYSQIIELFPAGGGGYLVASKLLSPGMGMVSGCALLIDYVLTITLSVASGADAIFSFLPKEWISFKLGFAVFGLIVLTVMNLRGVKESVGPIIPIFLTFIVTHFIMIAYTVFGHLPELPAVLKSTQSEIISTHSQLGLWGMIFLIMKAYSMGAGTFTGIEAVSNGISILREPRVRTGKRTMHYMAYSLSITVVGLMIGYLLFGVQHVPGKTLNAALFETITQGWGKPGVVFVLITLLSEAILLFVAAQTGFIDGPRVLSNMAMDRWFPAKFATLSDRLVTQNGILLMGGAALVLMVFAKGSVKFLVVLYSINVFVTFCMSQASMVKHWWQDRQPGWIRKIILSGSGFALCLLILICVILMKFDEGGWITLLITGMLVIAAIYIKRHYNDTARQLKQLDRDMKIERFVTVDEAPVKPVAYDPQSKTAVLLVNGFNGLGLHSLLYINRLFGKEFRNFVFLQVGVIDAGTFKDPDEIERFEEKTQREVELYAKFMQRQEAYAEAMSFTGLEVVHEILKRVPQIVQKYPNAVFFGGQIVFKNDSFWNRRLHNYTVFALQKTFYRQGIPFIILPIRLK
ncbi:MAG: APC family permease [Planctomycetaceae bacterium]|nr:APC family permease [Planctomycetaceae bacterium]